MSQPRVMQCERSGYIATLHAKERGGRKKERLFCMHASAYVRTWLTYVLGKMCVDGTAAFSVTPRTIRFVGRLCSSAYDRWNVKGNKICSNCSKESTSLKRHYSTIINQYIQNVWSTVRSQFLHQYSTWILRTLHINRALELYEVQTTILLTYHSVITIISWR